LTVSLVVILVYVASRWAGVREMIAAQHASPAYRWAASGLLSLLTWYELQPVGVALGWTLLALVLLEAGLMRGSRPFGFRPPRVHGQLSAAVLRQLERRWRRGRHQPPSLHNAIPGIFGTPPVGELRDRSESLCSKMGSPPIGRRRRAAHCSAALTPLSDMAGHQGLIDRSGLGITDAGHLTAGASPRVFELTLYVRSNDGAEMTVQRVKALLAGCFDCSRPQLLRYARSKSVALAPFLSFCQA
jgi:hypothetical protein